MTEHSITSIIDGSVTAETLEIGDTIGDKAVTPEPGYGDHIAALRNELNAYGQDLEADLSGRVYTVIHARYALIDGAGCSGPMARVYRTAGRVDALYADVKKNGGRIIEAPGKAPGDHVATVDVGKLYRVVAA
jgi:hypothetical protein